MESLVEKELGEEIHVVRVVTVTVALENSKRSDTATQGTQFYH